jgi:PilZ domain
MGSAVNGHRSDRRQSPRRRRVEDHGIVSTRIRPGHAASLVDVSAGGALVETPRRLLPGSAVELHVERRDERVAIRGSVARCSVSRVHATCVWYRGAIVFDRALPWFLERDANGYRILSHESRDGTPFRAPITPEVA